MSDKPLSKETLALLDFLCACRLARVPVRELHTTGLNIRHQVLINAGLVTPDTFEPTDQAYCDYLKSRVGEFRANREEPDSAPLAQEREMPPRPTAADEGGGAVASPAPPPTTGEGLAARLVVWCEQTGASKVRLSRYLFNSNNGITVLSTVKRPNRRTVEKIDAFLGNPVPADKLPERPKQQRRAPAVNPAPIVSDGMKAARFAQKIKQSIRRQARKALDDGLSPAQASPNAGVRGAMKEIVEQEEAARRAADPIEQAKTVIRSRGHNCYDAVVTEGGKGEGFFYINNRRVNGQELIDFAGTIKERRAW